MSFRNIKQRLLVITGGGTLWFALSIIVPLLLVLLWGIRSVFIGLICSVAIRGAAWGERRWQKLFGAGIGASIGMCIGFLLMVAFDISSVWWLRNGLFCFVALLISAISGGIIGGLFVTVTIVHPRLGLLMSFLPPPKQMDRISRTVLWNFILFGVLLVCGESLNLDLRPHLVPCITLTRSPAEINAVALSPDSLVIAWADGDGRIYVCSTTTGSELVELQRKQKQVYALAFSPNGELLATGGGVSNIGGELQLWNARTGQLLANLAGHRREVRALAFNGDGTALVSGSGWISGPVEIKMWDLTGFKQEASYTREDCSYLASLGFSPDGRYVAASVGQGVQMLNGANLTEVTNRVIPGRWIRTVAYSGDGHLLATGDVALTTGSENGGSPALILIWDSMMNRRVRQLGTHGEGINTVSFCPHRRTLASASEGSNYVWLWDIDKGKRSCLLKGLRTPVQCLAFSANGAKVAAGDLGGTVAVWDLTDIR